MAEEVIGVYGLGRFGNFWAGELSRKFTVVAYSRDRGRKAPPGVQLVDEDLVARANVLFLCVSISAVEEVLKRISKKVVPGTVVFDTCSVKVHPVRCMREQLLEDVEIFGSHPMFGPDSGGKGISGLPIVLTPERVKPETYSKWENNFTEMGLKVHKLSPEEHDHIAAYSQGVTHFIGRVLKELDLRPTEIGTLGYNKILEIVEQTCNDPLQLFLDLQRYNPYTGEMRKRLKKALNITIKTLEWGNESSSY